MKVKKESVHHPGIHRHQRHHRRRATAPGLYPNIFVIAVLFTSSRHLRPSVLYHCPCHSRNVHGAALHPCSTCDVSLLSLFHVLQYMQLEINAV
jgi:hypothetical protein